MKIYDIIYHIKVCPELPEPRVTAVWPDDLETMEPGERMAPTELPEHPEPREIPVTTDEMLLVWTGPRERLDDLV